ncbi:Probable RNA-directed DNA polymerase from transposon X-element [Eumeta japonica]|uniref:Probable RNA-directed DNA polymerase from transposon X-element n=1 Tax=Eumeta variegata TaxID=151549 RepID=A0A4C1X422_EUMVA|nr:Probable RNA-directed DNA polymerase from transposon X-element [Eumeta japonica]
MRWRLFADLPRPFCGCRCGTEDLLVASCPGIFSSGIRSTIHHYGITGRSFGLLESYLSDRIQRVDINGERSSGSAINMGVPQGSVLGQFLFLLYMNDLPHLVENGHGIVLFADDTYLLFKIHRHKSAFDEVNSTISEIVEWFSINNLLLNERKTKLVKFSLSDSKLIDTNVMVKNEFSGKGSAARRPLLRRCDVPEKFIRALVGDVEHPASDALDEFLYGFDTEVASD